MSELSRTSPAITHLGWDIGLGRISDVLCIYLSESSGSQAYPTMGGLAVPASQWDDFISAVTSLDLNPDGPFDPVGVWTVAREFDPFVVPPGAGPVTDDPDLHVRYVVYRGRQEAFRIPENRWEHFTSALAAFSDLVPDLYDGIRWDFLNYWDSNDFGVWSPGARNLIPNPNTQSGTDFLQAVGWEVNEDVEGRPAWYIEGSPNVAIYLLGTSDNGTIPVDPSLPLSMRFDFYTETLPSKVAVAVVFYDSSGAFLPTLTQNLDLSDLETGVWTTFKVEGIEVPEDAVWMILAIQIFTISVVAVSRVMVTLQPTADYYFDGDSEGPYGWAGQRGRSESIEYVWERRG